MGLFSLSRKVIRFAPDARESRVLSLGIEVLESGVIPSDPLQAVLERFFWDYLLDRPKGRIPNWAAFTFWTCARDSVSTLTHYGGFDLPQEYPRHLRSEEGIVGTLAARFLASAEVTPHISHQYKFDPLLAARPTIEKLGFRSGITLPLLIDGQLAAILKTYFKYPLDTTISAADRLIRELPQRLLLLLRLAEDHFTRLVTEQAGEVLHQQQPDSLLERSLLTTDEKRMEMILERTCEMLTASGGEVIKLREQGEEVLALWAESRSDLARSEHARDQLEVEMREWNVMDRPPLGRLRLLPKINGLAYSPWEKRLAVEVAAQLAIYLSTTTAVARLEHESRHRLELLELSSEAAQILGRASNPEEAKSGLLGVLKKAFPNSRPELLENQGAVGCDVSLPIEIKGRSFGILCIRSVLRVELQDTDDFFLRMIAQMLGLTLLSFQVLETVELVSREDARAELARDIVHALTAHQSAMITSLSFLQGKVNEVRNALRLERSRSKKVDALLTELDLKVDFYSDVARTQQSILARYRWLSSSIPEGELEEVDLLEIQTDLKRAVSVLSTRKAVDIKAFDSGRIPLIRWHKSEVYLILLNILHNAVKFSRKGGTVIFSVERSEVGVLVRIRDFGVGVLPEIRAKVWEYGFSTVAPGERKQTSGVGLSTVRSAIQRINDFLGANKASVELISVPNQFTEFQVVFPGELIAKEER